MLVFAIVVASRFVCDPASLWSMAPKAKAMAKRCPRHVVPAEMLEKKANLVAARAEAKRILKAVKAEDNREARKRQKLNRDAASLPLDLLRKVIQAKTDLPDIICPHCKASMDCRAEMTAAFVAVEAGRARQPAWPPKPLAPHAASTEVGASRGPAP